VKRLSGLWQAISTALAREGVAGARAYGVHVPYAYASTLKPLGEHEPLAWLAERMQRESELYLRTVDAARRFASRYGAWRHADPVDRNRPRFDQQWFSGIDGAMAYALVHTLRPARIVEIGSGHSTRFMARAIADAGLTRCVTARHAPR
jgi:predicted O-methyltransferase YrrM